MRYYLETSAVRRLSKKFASIKQRYKGQVFTSYLSVFELMSGIEQTTYSFRRAVLKACVDAKLTIDWRAPTQLIAGAFEAIEYHDSMTLDLQKLLSVVLRCKTMIEAEEECAVRHLRNDFARLRREDYFLSTVERADRNEMGRQFRSAVPQDQRVEDLSTLKPGLDTAEAKEERQKRIDKAEQTILLLTAKDISRYMPGSNVEKKVAHLVKNYNGSIMYHLRASAYAQILALLRGETPGKNDFLDISHFLDQRQLELRPNDN